MNISPLNANHMLAPYLGVKVITSLHMVDQVEDWSRVRSPSRARRRLRRGFRQRIVTIEVPKPHGYTVDGGRTLIIHPETWRVWSEAIRAGEQIP